MTELKTLKDIKHLVEREEGLPDYEAVDILTLKAEAVKWIKNLDERIKQDDEIKYNSECWRITKLWFVQFFNLTKQDLQEVN